MKTTIKLTVGLCALALIAAATPSQGQDSSAEKQVKEAIHLYYRAIATRDLEVMRELLHPTFIIIESGRENAKVHIINTSDTSKMLPLNDDWENLTLTDLSVSLSSTHPSVATVSYSVFHPTDPMIVEIWQDELKRPASELDEAQRSEISALLAAKGSIESECAMLALCEGRWRIVSLSVP